MEVLLPPHLEVEASTGRAEAWRKAKSSGLFGVMQVILFTWKGKGPDLECQ